MCVQNAVKFAFKWNKNKLELCFLNFLSVYCLYSKIHKQNRSCDDVSNEHQCFAYSLKLNLNNVVKFRLLAIT